MPRVGLYIRRKVNVIIQCSFTVVLGANLTAVLAGFEEVG